MRRALGIALVAVGGLLLSFSGGRYALGMLSRDRVRQSWDEARARAAVELARASVRRGNDGENLARGAPIARLLIPRIGLDEIVVEGVDAGELNVGPGHLPGTPLPGDKGNAVVSAHRDRHFHSLGAVQIGDTISTESGLKEHLWVVVAKRVVDGDERALLPTEDPTLTLTTCWPIRYLGPAPERLIVSAKLVRSAKVGGRRG